MSKVFVIPDVHLKAWMFEKADEMITLGEYDRIILLGDLVDDWWQEHNLDLYSQTIEATISFLSAHPNSWLCYGNHDMSYVWQALESGYSPYARDLVVDGLRRIEMILPEGHAAYIHRMDRVLFSHAGLMERFVLKHFGGGERVDIDLMLDRINHMGQESMWDPSCSPIWARPQLSTVRLYPMDLAQVVGHTPVEKPFLEKHSLEEAMLKMHGEMDSEHKGQLLTLDTFSTDSIGRPLGDQRFVWIDTEKLEFGYAE